MMQKVQSSVLFTSYKSSELLNLTWLKAAEVSNGERKTDEILG